MATSAHGPNTIDVNGAAMLLTVSGGGEAVHLTPGAQEPGTGRDAVPEYYFTGDMVRRSSALAGYDQAALTEPRWSPTTLCGREWTTMIGGDGGDLSGYGEVAYAPTCRRCLALIDRYYPKPTPDPRLPLVAQLAADAIAERGYVEIHDVPGDQQTELRTMLRTLARKRTGQSVRTYSIAEIIFAECEAVHRRRAEQERHQAAAAVNALLAGDPPPHPEREGVISWSTWDVG